MDELHGLCEVGGTLFHREHLLVEQALRPLLAIVHNLARGFKHIHMVGAQGEDAGARLSLCKRHPPLVQQAFHGVANAHRVIHHPVGIHHRSEAFTAEALPHIVGEA